MLYYTIDYQLEILKRLTIKQVKLWMTFEYIERKKKRQKYCFSLYEQVLLFVQSLSLVWQSATPCTAAHQASLSFNISRNLLKHMFIESVIPSNHLIHCCPLHFLPSIFPCLSLVYWVGSSIQVAKVLEYQLQHQSFQWILMGDFLYN